MLDRVEPDHAADGRIGETGAEPAQRVGADDDVGVGEHQHLPPGELRAHVARGVAVDPPRQGHEHVRRVLAQHAEGVVGRCVVDHDDLVIVRVARAERREAAADVAAAVVDRDDDGEIGRVAHRGDGRSR